MSKHNELINHRPETEIIVCEVEINGFYAYVGQSGNRYVAFEHEMEEHWETGSSPEEALGRLLMKQFPTIQHNKSYAAIRGYHNVRE